jgi:hypothetical protein
MQSKKLNVKLVIYPWPYQIKRGVLVDRNVDLWSAFSEEKNVELINMYPLFINHEKPESVLKKYFIEGDVHWNEYGHFIIFKELLKHLPYKNNY